MTCRLAGRTLKYHIYDSGELKADTNVGHSLVFTQATLDTFLKNRRPAHRARKDPSPRADTNGSPAL